MRPDAVTDLARALGRDHSTISRLVDRAAKRGLLHRRPEDSDQRVSLIELTPQGRVLAERFIKTLESQTEPLLATWPAARQQAAVQTLTELAETLEATAIQPADGSSIRTPRDEARRGRAPKTNHAKP